MKFNGLSKLKNQTVNHAGYTIIPFTVGGDIACRMYLSIFDVAAEAKHLAWLDLDKDESQEYRIATNLTGKCASANHHEIHNKIARALGVRPLTMVESRHNLAWKEHLAHGTEVMVHRKGATPAGKGVLGIIPGSMSTPGFLVRGKGDAASINSASHGAGRAMSRTAVFKTLDKAVIAAQSDLVEVLAKFEPRIVRMVDAKE